MNVDENKKVDILISALEERYKSTHNIRDRVQKTCVWILGILGAVAGWLLQTKTALSCSQKNIFISELIIIFIVIRFFYLRDLNKGFKNQLKAVAKIEKALGFYEYNFFMESGDAMYPDSWQNAGKEEGEGNFFQSSYALLYVGFLFLLLVILLAPEPVRFFLQY